jgi:PAS domain S-box-containing protein
MSVPPDMVQFSTNNDGSQQYNFFRNNGNANGQSEQTTNHSDGSIHHNNNTQGQNGNNSGSLTLQLPLPTPISGFSHEQQDQGQGLSSSNNVRQPQHEQQQAQQQQMAAQNAASFAQLMVQQAGNMLQQQQQGLRVAMPTMQQNQQPAQAMQIPFATDPNMFLQQLQFAQFQQQLMSAQQQQQQQQHMSNTMQQSVQNHFPQQPVAPASTVPSVPSQRTVQTAAVQSQPPSKKRPKDSDTAKKTPSAKAMTKQKLLSQSDSSAMLVSASDTDGEMFRSVKSKKLSLSELKKAMQEEPPPLDTSNMTEAEKVVANRDRNREHARNTRLRKKAYLEKLKATVDELCRERDSLVSERTSSANLLVEMHNTRTEVLMSFLALRTSNEKRRKLWSSIIDESSFVCVMPVTPYRSFPASEVQVTKCQRMILGIDGILADTSSLHVLLSTLVDRSKHPQGKINFRYTLISEESVVAGNHIMARWVMTTTDAVRHGAKMEVSKQGMLICRFNSAHKIVGLEIMFDVMAFMLQLKQATGSDGFSVVPNTVQTCQRTFDRPMVITMADPPYTIIQVNDLWTNMTGYKSDEVVGKLSCSVLQSVDTETSTVEAMMNEIRLRRPATAVLVNKSKSGEIFTNCLVVYPLCTDSRITYYLGLTLYSMIGRPNSMESSTVSTAETTASQVKNSSITSGEMNTQATVATPGLSIQNINHSPYELTGLLAGKVV